MENHLFDTLQTVFQKGFAIALSFVDDAILLIAARAGVQLLWLQWLGTALLVVSILYWIVQLVNFLSNHNRLVLHLVHNPQFKS